MMPECEWRFPALPVLTYPKVRSAPVLASHPVWSLRAPSSTATRPDLKLNTPWGKIPNLTQNQSAERPLRVQLNARRGRRKFILSGGRSGDAFRLNVPPIRPI
ncbi:MAG: hypothetical protein E5V28_03895 [Mesorhizobium sp.]|nr:MAG: hypothetical protein E5V28_03895 [Mesorhizobium sp.]